MNLNKQHTKRFPKASVTYMSNHEYSPPSSRLSLAGSILDSPSIIAPDVITLPQPTQCSRFMQSYRQPSRLGGTSAPFEERETNAFTQSTSAEDFSFMPRLFQRKHTFTVRADFAKLFIKSNGDESFVIPVTDPSHAQRERENRPPAPVRGQARALLRKLRKSMDDQIPSKKE